MTIKRLSLLFNMTNPVTAIRISIGFVYLLFGILKFFPNYSPAEELAEKTISSITFGLIHGTTALFLLAVLETYIGLAMIGRFALKTTIIVTLFHMGCTFLPIIVLPELVFTHEPYSLSIVGQYILKNLVIVSALWLLYSDRRNL